MRNYYLSYYQDLYFSKNKGIFKYQLWYMVMLSDDNIFLNKVCKMFIIIVRNYNKVWICKMLNIYLFIFFVCCFFLREN